MRIKSKRAATKARRIERDTVKSMLKYAEYVYMKSYDISQLE